MTGMSWEESDATDEELPLSFDLPMYPHTCMGREHVCYSVVGIN